MTSPAQALRRLRRSPYDPIAIPDRTGRSDLPVPWIIEVDQDGQARWLTFDVERSSLAHRRRRCQVCGLVVKGTLIHLRISDDTTSGPGAHPLCALFAIKLCPHYAGTRPHDHIGWAWNRPGQGYGANGSTIDKLLSDGGTIRPGAEPITLSDLRDLIQRPRSTS